MKKKMKNILFIDDDYSFKPEDFKKLEKCDYKITKQIKQPKNEDPIACIRQTESSFDAVIIDALFNDEDLGIKIFKDIRKNFPELPVIFYTENIDKDSIENQAYEDSEEKGAFPIVTKDTGVNGLIETMESLFSDKKVNKPPDSAYPFVIGTTKKMRKIADDILISAASDLITFIRGESGTGKELIAKAIHQFRNEPKGMYRPCNLANLNGNPDLIHDRLFGHIKGAFFGADEDKEGVFGIANGGTILLDEIGDLPLQSQAVFLRVLEERSFFKVGDAKNSIKLENTKIIAATNQNIEDMIEKGTFRGDLWYRMCADIIELPPLRERMADIEKLYFRFIDDYRKKNKTEISKESYKKSNLKKLMEYDWPGNIREFENVITQACHTAKKGNRRIKSEFINIPPTKQSQPSSSSLDLKEDIKKACDGKKSWDELTESVAPINHRNLMLGIIYELWNRNDKRPKGEELAKLLRKTGGDMRQILCKPKVGTSSKEGFSKLGIPLTKLTKRSETDNT